MLLKGIVYTFFFFKEENAASASLEARRGFISGVQRCLLMRFSDGCRCETHLQSCKIPTGSLLCAGGSVYLQIPVTLAESQSLEDVNGYATD